MKTKLAIYNEHVNIIIEFHYIHAMHNAMLVFGAGNESLQNEADRSILTSKLLFCTRYKIIFCRSYTGRE